MIAPQEKAGDSVDLSAVLTRAELRELQQLKDTEGVVSVEIMNKDGSPLCDLVGGSASLAATFSNMIDIAALIGGELGELQHDGVIVVRTSTFEIHCLRLAKVDAIVKRLRRTRSPMRRMTHAD